MQNLIEEMKVAAAEKNDVLYCGLINTVKTVSIARTVLIK
jgi:hypothetical protein